MFLSLPCQPEKNKLRLVTSSGAVLPGTELFKINKTKAKRMYQMGFYTVEDELLCQTESPEAFFQQFQRVHILPVISCLKPNICVESLQIKYVGVQGANLIQRQNLKQWLSNVFSSGPAPLKEVLSNISICKIDKWSHSLILPSPCSGPSCPLQSPGA